MYSLDVIEKMNDRAAARAKVLFWDEGTKMVTDADGKPVSGRTFHDREQAQRFFNRREPLLER